MNETGTRSIANGAPPSNAERPVAVRCAGVTKTYGKGDAAVRALRGGLGGLVVGRRWGLLWW